MGLDLLGDGDHGPQVHRLVDVVEGCCLFYVCEFQAKAGWVRTVFIKDSLLPIIFELIDAA